MPRNQILAFTGIAGAGKDLAYQLLSQYINCKRVALADELKREMRPFILDRFSIDLLNCSRAEKDLVRPLLVEYARIKRQQTNGRYFIDKITDYVKSVSFNSTVVITDLRHCVYERDELYWLKNELKGSLIHIKKHKLINNVKVYTESPISDERLNDPILEKSADHCIDWPETNDLSLLSCHINELMLKFEL